MWSASDFFEKSYTPFQAVENAVCHLKEKGFIRLGEGEKWNIERGKKYFTVRDGSAIIAFTVGKEGEDYFKIASSHLDSPCLKLKASPVINADGYEKLNVETYGGGLWYTFFDRPLRLAGRIAVKSENGFKMKNVVSPYTLIVPSLAIHMARGVNDGFSVNPQVDLLPLAGVSGEDIFSGITNEEILSYDLYLTPSTKPYTFGVNDEFLCSPRIDNLASVFSSLGAISSEENSGICVSACFGFEEVGSSAYTGAASDFLKNTVERIAFSLGYTKEELLSAYGRSVCLSVDGAHAVHPNHGEKCDPTSRPVLGGGVILKSHAGGAYTTSARSAAIVKGLFEKAGAKLQEFYNRSDMRSGSTLGAISLSELGILSADIGIPMLAMHSACETCHVNDVDGLTRGLKAFYSLPITIGEDEFKIGE